MFVMIVFSTAGLATVSILFPYMTLYISLLRLQTTVFLNRDIGDGACLLRWVYLLFKDIGSRWEPNFVAKAAAVPTQSLRLLEFALLAT